MRRRRLSGGRVVVFWATCANCGAPAPVMEDLGALGVPSLMRTQCCRIFNSRDAGTVDVQEHPGVQGLMD